MMMVNCSSSSQAPGGTSAASNHYINLSRGVNCPLFFNNSPVYAPPHNYYIAHIHGVVRKEPKERAFCNPLITLEQLTKFPFCCFLFLPSGYVTSREETEKLLESCQKLLDHTEYTFEMMPFMYVILKYTRVDIKTAESWVKEGTKERKLTNFLWLFWNKYFLLDRTALQVLELTFIWSCTNWLIDLF